MIQPVELQGSYRATFDGVETNTADVWATLSAAHDGHLDRVRSLVTAQPILACCKYNYAPPLHFAVREGHVALVEFLIASGGLFPEYRSDRFLDSFLTLASERGHDAIVALLRAIAERPESAPRCLAPTDAMTIDFPDRNKRERFLKLISGRQRSLTRIAAALDADPTLATDPYQCWGEGVLAVPCNHADRELVELLLQRGARVPDVTKWCARYYFKHDEIAGLLMQHGMNPNHMNWHHVTLLHELAFAGDTLKAQLLLDHGADINAVDEEFRSTPLGLAARGGRIDMVRFLLDRGADRHKANAEWATPLAWAMARGHREIVGLLGA